MVHIIIALFVGMFALVPGLHAVDSSALAELLPGVWRGYSNENTITIHWHITITKKGKEFRGQAVGWFEMPEELAMEIAKGKASQPASETGNVFGEEFRIVLDGETVTFGGSNLRVVGRTKPLTVDNMRGTLSAPGYLTGVDLVNGPKRPSVMMSLCKEALWEKPTYGAVKPGQTVSMTCEGLPYHYMLYVPKNYDPSKPWPLLVHASPGGAYPFNTKLCEEVGWISIGLTESRNGPWPPVIQNRDAALFDIRRRLNIDWKRVTFGGESGGGRASVMSWLNHPSSTCSLLLIIAGEISPTAPMPPPTVPIFFITGKTDMNRGEVERRYQESLKLKRPTDIIIHDGGHTEGPPENVTKALRWLWEHQPKPVVAGKK